MLGIRDILVRIQIQIQIQIHGSAPLTNRSDLDMASDPDPTPDPTPFFSDFKDAKQFFRSFFSYNLPSGILSPVFQIRIWTR
jgi:hypothetical protein